MTKRKQRGFSLVEVSIAAGLAVVIMVAAGIFITRTMRQQKRIQLADLRGDIVNKVEAQIGSKINLRRSAEANPNNEALRRCIEQRSTDADGDCVSGSPQNQVSFYLHLQVDPDLTDADVIPDLVLAGTEDGVANGPILYDADGMPNCDTSKKICPAFAVVAYFWPKCQGNLPTCDIAQTVFTRFIVRTRGDALEEYQVQSYPPEKVFFDNARSSEFSYRIEHLEPRQTTQRCPANTFLVGVNEDGTIECKCASGYSPVDLDNDGTGDIDPNGHPICPGAGITCGADQLLKGLDDNYQPVCADTRIRCKKINFDDESAVCKDGGWLEEIDFGYCKPGLDSKKDDDREITCEDNKGVCCRYIEK